MLILLAMPALAADLYSGIDPTQVPGLGEPTYLAGSEWTAPVEGDEAGSVRVFVGKDVASARGWFDAERARLGSPPISPLVPAEAVRGNGETLILLREGNVAALVLRGELGALGTATMLVGSLQDATPWPEPPTLHLDNSVVTVGGGPWAHVQFVMPLHLESVLADAQQPQGATVIQVLPLSETSARVIGEIEQLRVTVWDATGRSVTVAPRL